MRALVLGGGGITGIAWELGMLAGLADAGLDLTEADLVVGTSAGAAVGAQVTSGASLADLYVSQLAPSSGEIAARMGRGLLLRWLLIALSTRDERRYLTRVGRMALAARTVSEAERRAVIEARLPVREWPDRRLVVTAVDALTGEFVAFDRDSGAGLIDAVGASCAVPGVWPPVTIDGRRYIDGGARSSVNADLAAGADQVVVLAPLTRGIGPGAGVAKQVAGLRGARTVVISPDSAALRAIGRNPLDPARREPSAQAGHRQAAVVRELVAGVWR